jgi:hypothetical protein
MAGVVFFLLLLLLLLLLFLEARLKDIAFQVHMSQSLSVE